MVDLVASGTRIDLHSANRVYYRTEGVIVVMVGMVARSRIVRGMRMCTTTSMVRSGNSGVVLNHCSLRLFREIP